MFSIACGGKKLLVVVCLVLIAFALPAISCGEEDASNQKTDSEDVSTNKATIDGSIKELDSEMDSVDPDDFQDGNLDDSALGL